MVGWLCVDKYFEDYLVENLPTLPIILTHHLKRVNKKSLDTKYLLYSC